MRQSAVLFNPGTKFDYVLILSGKQGIGKSTFFMKLCCNEDWYLENLKTIDKGKDAAELIQGKIIVEFNELLAVKSAIEGVKSFVTARSDEYRGLMQKKVKNVIEPVFLLEQRMMHNSW